MIRDPSPLLNIRVIVFPIGFLGRGILMLGKYLAHAQTNQILNVNLILNLRRRIV